MEDLGDDLMEAVMLIIRTRMKLEIEIRTKGKKIPFISMIKTIEIKEEEARDKDLEEEASMGNVFTREKEGMEH